MHTLDRDPEVRTKRDGIARWKAGEFGNRLQMWDSFEEFKASGFTGIAGYRSRIPDQKRCQTHMTVDEIEVALKQEVATGASWDEFYIGESPDDNKLLVQGEFFYSLDGPTLFFNTTPGINMRTALKTAQHVTGVRAIGILRHFLDGSSFDDMMDLTNLYPEAVVEFAAYSIPLGSCHRNTIVWEVRNF